MVYRLAITAADMREINRSAILEIIRRESPIARSAIAKQMDVSLLTVIRIIYELMEDRTNRYTDHYLPSPADSLRG
jgi:hypothetical protein